MQPVFAKGDSQTVEKLLELRRQAQRDKAPRVALRIQGILMSLARHTAGDVARRFGVHRSTVSLWIHHWNHHAEQGLWEGQRSGRPRSLDSVQQKKLCDILDNGPAAYGLEIGMWTSASVAQIIREKFQRGYHPGHVRKMLRQLGYPAQRSKTRRVQPDLRQRRKWIRYTYPNLKKTPKSKDEAASRGDGEPPPVFFLCFIMSNYLCAHKKEIIRRDIMPSGVVLQTHRGGAHERSASQGWLRLESGHLSARTIRMSIGR